MSEPMSPEEFYKCMVRVAETNQDDCEAAHVQMDELMAQLLEHLGYSNGIQVFRGFQKWYS